MHRGFLPAVLACALPLTIHAQADTPIQIVADLTEAPRKLYHAEIDLPVKPGPLTLTTPQWIPGNHRPSGPVENITGVVFTANGRTLAWRRDDVNLFEFHVNIPQGVTLLHAHLDCIVTSRATTRLAVLEWEKLLLYPANIPVRQIAIQPSVTVPQAWGIGTALTPTASGLPPATVSGVDESAHLPLPGSTTTRFALQPSSNSRTLPSSQDSTSESSRLLRRLPQNTTSMSWRMKRPT